MDPFESLVATAARVRAGEVSAREVVLAALARIERLDPTLRLGVLGDRPAGAVAPVRAHRRRPAREPPAGGPVPRGAQGPRGGAGHRGRAGPGPAASGPVRGAVSRARPIHITPAS